MLRPPQLDVASVTLDYFLYNAGKDFASFGDSGAITVPSVVCSAWRIKRERAAVFFSNLLKDEQTVKVTLDARLLGLEGGNRFLVTSMGRDGVRPLGSLDGQGTLTIDLPPRRIIAIELQPELP